MKAVLNGSVVAEAADEDLVSIEGNWYFPPSSVPEGVLADSDTPYTCPWKGECQYYTVNGVPDLAWSYPEPYPGAIERVGRDFSGYVAFAKDVEVGA